MNIDQYKEICAVLRDYAKYEMLYKKYFCEVVTTYNAQEQVLIFSDELYEKHLEFIKNWPLKQQKIEARLKKNSYFKQAGKNRDEKDLRLGNRKFDDLSIYFKLDSEFSALEDALLKKQPRQTLEQHIQNLKNKKIKFESEHSGSGQGVQPQM